MAERSFRVVLPGWLFDQRRERLAWILWVVVFSVFTVMSILRPGTREVLHVYRNASDAWLSGRPIYPQIDYPLPFVVLFTPFARMPVSLCEIVWRALVMSVYVSSLWRLARTVDPGPRKLFFFISILSIQAAFGSIKSGQTNLLLAGALAHAAVDWMGSRRAATVAWLSVAVVAKPIGIVMVLLLAAADFALIPWLAGGLLLTASLPLLFDPWPYVALQYRAWWAEILSVAASKENRFDDINGLLRALHVHVPTAQMMLMRAAAAVLTLAVWWVASKRFGQPGRGLTLLGLSSTYLMLFNPRTESNSYVMLSHAIAAFAALVLLVEGRRVGWLLAGLDVAMANGSFGKTIWLATKLWLMPVLAIVFFLSMIWEIWSASQVRTALADRLRMPPPGGTPAPSR